MTAFYTIAGCVLAALGAYWLYGRSQRAAGASDASATAAEATTEAQDAQLDVVHAAEVRLGADSVFAGELRNRYTRK